MFTDSEDDFVPLQYDTPSPYQSRRPPGLLTHQQSNVIKKLAFKLEETNKIEEKYNKRILENINRSLFVRNYHFNNQEIVSELLDPLNLENNSESFKDVIRTINVVDSCVTYFHPDYYYNKFNQDFLIPKNFLSRSSLLANLTVAEIIELIKADALIITTNSNKERRLIQFLLTLGSVTEDIQVSKKILALLEGNLIPYKTFKSIIENWGKVDSETTLAESHGKPEIHNFELILKQIEYSICKYRVMDALNTFKILINISLDPLFLSLGHLLLKPLHVGVEYLLDKGVEVDEIVDSIDFEHWPVQSIVHVVSLLLNSKCCEYIGLVFGFKSLSWLLTKTSSNKFTINMETLFDILLTGENQFITSDLPNSYQYCLLFELIASRLPRDEHCKISKIIDYMKKITNKFNSEVKYLYFNEIINRIIKLWK